MERRDHRLFSAALALVLTAGLPASVWAFGGGRAFLTPEPAEPVDSGGGEAGEGPEQPARDPEAKTPESAMIRFSFKGAPFDEVLDFFSRESGLPIIYERDVPEGTLTFISGKALSFEEALTVLNLNLEKHNARLRREKNYLYLADLKQAFQKPAIVQEGEVAEDTPPDKVVNITIPLSNASAEQVAEQIKPLLGPNGMVTPVPTQNMVILIESAAQVRRLGDIIRSIDAQKPADARYELFKLEHAQAEQVVEALKSLIGVRERTVIIDKGGKRRVVEEDEVAGVRMQPDPRTNSVLVVGPRARLDTVEELVAMLDVPEGGQGEQQMMTFVLRSIAAQAAAGHLRELYAKIPEDRRPTILPLEDVGKVTVVGPGPLLVQGRALLEEVDPGSGDLDETERRRLERVARVIGLEHIDARSAERVAQQMLSARQRQVLRYTPAPNQEGLIVSGPPSDVESLESLLAGLDVEREVRADVRLLRVDSPQAQAEIDRAQELFQASAPADEPEPRISFNPENRTLTLIGQRGALQRFEQVLREVQASVVPSLETRTYDIAQREPSELTRVLPRLARPLLEPADGSAYQAPAFEAIDELDQLIVRAQSGQFETIERLIAELDVTDPSDREFRVIRISRGQLEDVAGRARDLYDKNAQTRDPEELGALSVETDPTSGSLLVTGSREAVRLFDQSLKQAQQLVPPDRTTEIIDIRHVEAAQIIEPLREMLSKADPIDESRRVPDPRLSAIERTNSLVVTAERAQHGLIRDFVDRLDQLEQVDLPPLRLLQLRAADATSIASMLQQQYNKRPQTERTAEPVEVRADAATNTLIVSAHEDLFSEIKAFVEEVNKERKEGPERVTVLFNLKVAKAVDVAQAMDKLYPEPPMPRDRRGRPMPWLQKEKEVTVSADASTNSLIIDAPADRIESLEELAEKLDRVEVPPVAELRTYRVTGADPSAVKRTLDQLASEGNLSAPPAPGKKAVPVMIETEPKSSTLIVAGDEVTFERVESVLEDLSAVPVEKQLRIIPIVNADAERIRERAVQIYDAQIAQIPEAGPVEVTVDDRTNSLEVVADAEAMDRFMGVIEQLQEQAGPEREVRLIDLRVARAREAVDFLAELLASSEMFQAEGGPDPVFDAIESTNTVMVSAPPSKLRIIEQLIRNMDRSQSAETGPLRILRLRSTDATNLARVLQSRYDQRPIEAKAKHPVSIEGDAATNTLLVSAHPEVLPEIEKVVRDLNEAQAFDAEGREIAVYPLKFARAEELAETIDAMFPEPPMPIDPRTRRPRPDLRQPKEIVVRADRATNSLIVDAPAKRLAGFQELVESLDTRKLSDDVVLRTYRLERADLDAIRGTLRELADAGALGATGQTPVTIETEPVTRTLIVSGPEAIFAKVEDVLGRFEVRPDRPETTMRLYALEHAHADRLQPLLERLLVARLEEQREASGDPMVEAESLLEVAADKASNTLIINAPESIQQIATQLIDQLDVEEARIGKSIIRVVPLTHASASEVAQTLNQTIPTMDLPTGGAVSVIAAASGSAVLLTGAEPDLAKLEALIEPLDQRPTDETTQSVETFALEHGDASEIAQIVQRLLEDQLRNDLWVIRQQIRYRRGELPERASVRVEADARTNALIISAPEPTLELARTIIERLDAPAGDGERRIETFTPTRATPGDLVQTVTRILDARETEPRRRVELVHEARTASVVVVGPREGVEEALDLLERFDAESVALPALDLRVIEVEHADVATVARTVERMLRDRARWPEALRRAERARLPVAQPSVTPDPDASRLLVSAPTPLMALAGELVNRLDAEPSGPSMEMRVYSLREGSAESIAGTLERALRAGLEPNQPQPTVTAEARSNTLVVTAAPAQLEHADELVNTMDDAVDTEQPGVRTIFLDNARAEALAPIVEQVLTQQSALDLIPAWARYNFLLQTRRRGEETRLDQGVRVVAEQRLNALVVSAPSGMLELAEQIVGELDVDRERGEDRIVRVIAPTNADAPSLAQNIEALFTEDAGDGPPPIVRVDAQSNTMIVRATETQLARIESLVEEIDRVSLTSSRQLRMIRVDPSRAEAAAVARSLKQMLERDGRVKVEVISAEDLLKESDEGEGEPEAGREQSSATMPGVEGRASPFARPPIGPAGRPPDGLAPLVGSWMVAASQPASPGARWWGDRAADRARPPREAKQKERPADAEEPAEAPAPESPEGASGGDDAEKSTTQPTVTIAVDPSTNSLMVVGSSRMTDRVAELARELERQMPAEPTSVRIVRLPEGFNPWRVTSIVRSTVQQVGRASAQNPGGFTGGVAATADPEGNGVIVWANDTDFEIVGELIGSLTRAEASPSLTVKVYPLENTRARNAVRAVEDLISPSPRGRQARLMREMDLSVEGPGGETFGGTIDPTEIGVWADPTDTSIIVSAPSEAYELIDGFIGLIDQSPVRDRLEIRQYELDNARAADLTRTLQQLFDARRQGPGARDMPRARFVADGRSNAILVTASGEQHEEVERLVAQADKKTDRQDVETRVFELESAQASSVQRALQQVVIGGDRAKRELIQLSADNQAGTLVVRAPGDEMEAIGELVERLDREEASQLPIRTIRLEQADAEAAAQSLTRLFQTRARAASAGGRRVRSEVAITGDRESGTLIVSASDEDFETIEKLAGSFDERAESAELQVRIVELANARVSNVEQTLNNLYGQLRFDLRRGRGGSQEQIYIQTNQQTNSVVLLGRGEVLDTVERIVESLDSQPSGQAERTLRAITLERSDPQAIQRVIRESFSTPGWRSWWGRDPEAVQVEVDRQRRMVMLIGTRAQVEEAASFIERLEQAGGDPDRGVRTIRLQHAQANRAASSITQFLRDRARAEGRPQPTATVIGSPEGNVLIVSADEETTSVVEGLIEEIDQPELGEDRTVEVRVLNNAVPREVARTVQQMFPARRSDERVIVTPQQQSRSLVISAPQDAMGEVLSLVDRLDEPVSTEDMAFETVPLKAADAGEVARSLQQSLPENVNVRITTVERSNSLLLTGSPDSIELVKSQITQLDTEPARTRTRFKRIRLEHAMVDDVWITLTEMLRADPRRRGEPRPSVDYSLTDNTLSISATADQMERIESMIEQLDVPPATDRTTEFVKLEHANAEQTANALQVFYGRMAPEATTPGEQRVTIVPDPASNSLVISAGEAEWEGIRSLLEKLDAPEYDTSRQLVVIPLKHADAQSVAEALNQGFQASIQRQLERERIRLEQQRRDQRNQRDPFFFEPQVLVETEETPSVAAEALTNSLIVFASRKDLQRIEAVVQRLDVPEVLKLPEARVIALRRGRASQIARSVREMFARSGAQRGSPRGVRIVGDDASNTLIVRAEDAEFEQIRELVESLQQRVDDSRATPRIIRVSSMPAARLRDTLRATFAPIAQREGETLSIEIERGRNALIVAASDRLFEEIRAVVDELDAPPPWWGEEQGGGGQGDPEAGARIPAALGQRMLILDVENAAPESIVGLLTQMGVTRPQPADRPGLVAEPVRLVPLESRQAIAVLASPGDAETVRRVIESLDEAPADSLQHVEVVNLRLAEARAMVGMLERMLDADATSADAGPARALAEHVRRLSIAQPGWDKDDVEVDLSRPIRLLADEQTNSVVIASTQANARAISEVIRSLDKLPVGEAVTIRIFPLENSSAERVRGVIEELFRRGEEVRRLPGTERKGLPSTATGKALAGEIAASVDARTNALIVAGTEESVALVEVLVKDLDSEAVGKWVEPAIVTLEHADPVELAETLRAVLMDGLGDGADVAGLQQQVARLRLLQEGGDPFEPGQTELESDLFAPLDGLSITPEENLGALIVVGSRKNIGVVRALAAQLDVEAAAAGNEVRIYPLDHASADRVADTVRRVFTERERAGAIRAEDRLIVSADLRTNSLVVSTSPRSRAILEKLLDTLDAEESNVAVDVRVIPVPGADVEALAPKIQRLMRERIEASRRAGVPESPSDAFVIEPEKATQSVIVAASEENFRIVEELIEALKTGESVASGSQVTEIITLAEGSASEIAEALQDLYVEPENEKRGDRAVRVVANDRLNALIVTGTDRDISEIRRLSERLTSTEVRTAQEIRRFELDSANALEVVNLLETILAGRPIGGGRGVVASEQATRLRFIRDQVAEELETELGREPVEAEIDGAIRDRVRMTPDLRTNSVVVSAPSQMVKLIEQLILDLDQTSAGDRKVEVFQLVNADASAMRELLIDLFQPRDDQTVLLPGYREPSVETTPGEGEGEAAAAAFGRMTVTRVTDERRRLSITVDSRTNSLLVSGTQEQLELVADVVENLDTVQGSERERVVYHLRNAQAIEVEETLREYFDDEAARVRETLRSDQLGALSRQLEREVTIVGDEQSNKLVISASPRYIETVTQIVRELDAAPPQVVIQVLLAEVTVDSSDTWGLDFNVGPFGGEDFVVGSTPAGAAVATAIGVPSLAVSSGDFDVMIRALESRGRLEVLSKPVVTVNNNEEAFIQVGEDIAIVESVDTFEDRSQANVIRRDIGIILNVTPSISADGFVRMDIMPEISDVSARTTQISADFESPIITQRRVDTTVTVKDGQTVVIGGLIETSDTVRRTKVPGLGDIPVLGQVFRTHQIEKVKTELMVILTPRIIGGRDAASIERNAEESWRMIDESEANEAIRDILDMPPRDPKKSYEYEDDPGMTGPHPSAGEGSGSGERPEDSVIEIEPGSAIAPESTVLPSPRREGSGDDGPDDGGPEGRRR